MTKALFRIYFISYQLFKLFYFGKPALLFAVKYLFFIDVNGIATAYFGRLQGNTFQVFGECSKQFLRHVGSTQEPAAFGAVFNSNKWLHSISCILYSKYRTWYTVT